MSRDPRWRDWRKHFEESGRRRPFIPHDDSHDDAHGDPPHHRHHNSHRNPPFEWPPRHHGRPFRPHHPRFWTQHGGPPWAFRGEEWQRQQKALFWRFAATFGGIMLLLVTGIGLLALVFTRIGEGFGQAALLTWMGGCVVAIALPLIALAVAVTASRDITGPLADVITAADAVASGDLSVRVPETNPSRFGQLARTFNRMVEELQRIDEQRRNLTADVAHELRTPLHVIQGNLEGILDGVYQPTPEHIQMLLEETQLLSRLVEDLRTLSLAESGHLPLRKEPVQVADLLADLATSFSAQAQSAGINLKVETQRLENTTIQADVMRLNQVLANLIVNALRYTPAGGTITLGGEPTDAGVRLTVCDTGKGISAEDLPHVFDRFWRGDTARTHKDGVGGGLGLAIVKQLVELHGGEVSVQSTPGQGTTFVLDLPGSPDDQ